MNLAGATTQSMSQITEAQFVLKAISGPLARQLAEEEPEV